MIMYSSPSSLMSLPEYSKKDTVAGLHIERDGLALIGFLAVADGNDLPFLRLFFCRVGMKSPPAVVASCCSSRLTTMRSWSGRMSISRTSKI